MSYFHKREIIKGEYGQLSKIREELDEAVDAEEEGQELLLIIELADIIGAVRGVANKYGITLDQLIKFSELRSEVAVREIQESKRNY